MPVGSAVAGWALTMLALVASVCGSSAGAGEFEDALSAFDAGEYGRSHDLMLALAARGDPRAELMVVGNYYTGWGVPAGYTAAQSWAFQAKADAKQADFDFVIARWRTMAEAGDPLAQMLLGTLYNSGFGVPMDDAEAFRWIKRSADQGNPRGQYALGTLYEFGNGTPADMRSALAAYGRAAAQGDNWAQYQIGVAYQFGRGVERNYATAATWYRKAAELGNPEAAYDLGYLYDTGAGVPRSAADAVKWYWAAAQGGSVLALNNLAVMYMRGEGVNKDPATAYQFSTLAASKQYLVANRAYVSSFEAVLRKASRQLDDAERREALFQLGIRCRDGNGVPRDQVRAYRWISQSIASEPDPELRTARTAVQDELAAQMHPDAIARAK